MDRDEQVIRSLVATWMEATAAGDLARVLELMADDVVFLGPGRPPMRGKDGFGTDCWNHITIAVYPVGGGLPTHRAGPALSVLRRKPDGAWVIFRDANMVAPAPQPST